MSIEYDEFIYTVISQDVDPVTNIVHVTIESQDTLERFGTLDRARESTGYTIEEYNLLEVDDWNDRLIDIVERRVDNLLDYEKDKEDEEFLKDQITSDFTGTTHTAQREAKETVVDPSP